jgi:transcriptional regulator with XRE-family HTH domain
VPEYRKAFARARKAWERFAPWAAKQGFNFKAAASVAGSNRGRVTGLPKGLTQYGVELQAARKVAGLSRPHLAAVLDLSVSHLMNVEYGRSGPLGAEHDAAIHRELGIPVRRLEVLRALARGTVDVSGLGEQGLERVLVLIAGLRAGADLADAVAPDLEPHVAGCLCPQHVGTGW